MNKPQKRRPQRKCVGCGEIKDKSLLVRVVRPPAPDDASAHPPVTIDLRGKLNGRGAYLCKNPECLTKAIKAKRLERALLCPIPQSVCESLFSALAAELNH